MQNCHLVLSHLNNNLPGIFRDFLTSSSYANNQHRPTPQKGTKLPYHMLKLPTMAYNL